MVNMTRRVDSVPRRVLSRLARWSVLHGNVFGLVPVIVYQMAKVGSSAVVEALRIANPAVFHVHRMHAEHLRRMRDRRRAHGWLVPPVPAPDRLGLKLNEKVIAAGHRAKIVTLVREPIARNFSSYFEHLNYIWHAPNAHAAIAIEELCRGFVERYTHDEPLTWFDEEMLPVLGIDVYDHPFPAVGHLTIETQRFEVLVLKCELSDDTKRAALSAFLGW